MEVPDCSDFRLNMGIARNRNVSGEKAVAPTLILWLIWGGRQPGYFGCHQAGPNPCLSGNVVMTQTLL